MSEISTEVSTPAAPVTVQPIWGKTAGVLIELLAVLFWTYAVIKLFMFDIDVSVVSHLTPALLWVLNYKFPIILSGIVLAMLVTRSLTLGLAFLYVAFYPFVILVWKIPRFIWGQRSWLLAFAFINAGVSFVRSFKRDFILGTIFLVCAVLILNFYGAYALYASIAGIFVVVVTAFVLSFLKAFKPSAVFSVYKTVFPAIRRSNVFPIDLTYRGLPVAQLSSDQLTKRTDSLQNAVLYNLACLFISKRLRDYQNSKINTITYMLSLVGLLLFTVLSFALIDFAAYKLDSHIFESIHESYSFFTFLYYSMGSMFYATNGLVPVLPVSQIIQMLQFFFSLLLLAILATIVITMRTEKYTAELSSVIDAVEEEGRSMEGTIRAEFDLDGIASAIEALQTAKAGLVGAIIFLSKDLD